jgi:HJR/Mrr/RecB family endonuclease
MGRRRKKKKKQWPLSISILAASFSVFVLLPLSGILTLFGKLLGGSTGGKNTAQKDGYQYEEYVARRMRAKGYHNVTVTQKSRDYGADIIAYDWLGRKTCVQCKKYSSPVGPKAVQEVYGALAYYKGKKGIVVSSSGYTASARTLAKQCGVELWEM